MNFLNINEIIESAMQNVLANPEARAKMSKAIKEIEEIESSDTTKIDSGLGFGSKSENDVQMFDIPFTHDNEYKLTDDGINDISDNNILAKFNNANDMINDMTSVLRATISDEFVTIISNRTARLYKFKIIPYGVLTYELSNNKTKSEVEWKGWSIEVIDNENNVHSTSTLCYDEIINIDELLQLVPQKSTELIQALFNEYADDVVVKPFNASVHMTVINTNSID